MDVFAEATLLRRVKLFDVGLYEFGRHPVTAAHIPLCNTREKTSELT